MKYRPPLRSLPPALLGTAALLASCSTSSPPEKPGAAAVTPPAAAEAAPQVAATPAMVQSMFESFTTEQKEAFAKAMGLATQDEVKDLKRQIAALEREIADLRLAIALRIEALSRNR